MALNLAGTKTQRKTHKISVIHCLLFLDQEMSSSVGETSLLNLILLISSLIILATASSVCVTLFSTESFLSAQ